MSEWLSYGLSDFLLFSPRTYYRLFELYNEAVWPAQAVAACLALTILLLLHWKPSARDRLIAAILAACWLWVAVTFHLQRYATINWAASWFAAGFAIEAGLLAWLGVVGGRLSFQPDEAAGKVGLGVFLFALVVQPLLGSLLGRPWRQAEIFGLAPDPTAVATLGLLLLVTGTARWALIAIPVAWCAITGATLWAMAVPDAPIAPGIAVLALLLSAWKMRAARA